MFPQMRRAYKGQLAVLYRVGSLGQRPRLLVRLLRVQLFAHGYYSQVSFRLADIGHDFNVKHEVKPSSPFMAHLFFLP